MFTDNSGGPGTVDAPNDKIVQVWPAQRNGITVNLASAEGYVRFDARGMKVPPTAATFTVSSTGCSGTNASQILVTVAGSPQLTKIACP